MINVSTSEAPSWILAIVAGAILIEAAARAFPPAPALTPADCQVACAGRVERATRKECLCLPPVEAPAPPAECEFAPDDRFLI